MFLPVTLALMAAPVVLMAAPRYLLGGAVQRWRALQIMWRVVEWPVRIVCGAAGLPCALVYLAMYALAYGMCWALHNTVARCSDSGSEFHVDFDADHNGLIDWARKRVWSWPFIAPLAVMAAPCGIVAAGCYCISIRLLQCCTSLTLDSDGEVNDPDRGWIKPTIAYVLSKRIDAAEDARAEHRLGGSASLGEEDQGLLLLKVAAAVLVCTMVSMGRFAGYYTGEATETWSDLASAVLARLPALNFSFRVAFAWPSRLAWDVQVVLGVAIGAFSVRYLLLAFRKAWTAFGLETWGDGVFAADLNAWDASAPGGAAKDGKDVVARSNDGRLCTALAARVAGVAATVLSGVLLCTAAAFEWCVRLYIRSKSAFQDESNGAEDAAAEQTDDATVRGYVRSFAASGGKSLMLDLHQCVQVTPRALSNLSTRERASVRGLDLSGMRIDAVQAKEWARVIKANRALKSAKLGGNSIGDGGTTALSEALKSNSTLEKLELPKNGISVAGAQSLANMLQFNRALTSLKLSWNEIGAGGAKAIAAALPQS